MCPLCKLRWRIESTFWVHVPFLTFEKSRFYKLFTSHVASHHEMHLDLDHHINYWVAWWRLSLESPESNEAFWKSSRWGGWWVHEMRLLKHGEMVLGSPPLHPRCKSSPPGEAKCLFWGSGDHRNQPLINVGTYNVLWILSDKRNSNIQMCWGLNSKICSFY